jgi:transcriptional regulatory protein RtcR
MKNIIFGFLGTTMDAGTRADRWQKWRPTIALCQHEDQIVDRLELFVTTGRNVEKTDRLIDIITEDIARVSPDTTVRIHALQVNDPWDFGEMYGALYDFAQTYKFVPEREQYSIHITTGTHVAQICWFLLAESRHIPALLMQTTPPRRGEPMYGTLQTIDLDLSKYNLIALRYANAQEQARTQLKSGIATRNAQFNQMIEEIEHVAVRSKAPMLFLGPTGAGKSFLAKRVFELKHARHQLSGEFVDVNCATLRGEGAMSALFGHVKGAFTGAATDRKGYLRAADKGLLFLDEIGELGLDEQAMLLKAVEDKRFFAVGGDREVASDFQLIAGTNRDLGAEVAAGRFREDLYARINLWTYSLPSLAERREDIEPNLDFELQRQSHELSVNVRFNTEARKQFLAFAKSIEARWAGNFRDLSASAQRMATLADAGRITSEIVQSEVKRLKHLNQQAANDLVVRPGASGNDEELLNRVLGKEADNIDLFDRVQLACVLRVCLQARSQAEAGRTLFAASRQQRTTTNDSDRVAKYLAKYGLKFEELRG